MAFLILMFLLAFGLSVILTPLVRSIAIRKGWVAQPRSDRWHKKPTALMGGIAIFTGCAVPLIFIADFGSIWRVVMKAGGNTGPSLGATILIGSAFLFALGLLDDFLNIKPHTKLIGQILAASLVTFVGFRLHWFNSLTLDTMATLFWIVGITNASNLLDNMDGLCAGVGLVAAVSLGVLYQPAAAEAVLAAVILAGALAGFLIYNFNPAKIFMGDSGSLVIGYSISVLSLFYAESSIPSTRLAGVTVPVLVLMVPILDTSLVTIIRLLSGRKASTGGRDHTSHRLVLMGFSERSAVLFLYGAGGVSGFSAVFVSRSDSMTSPAVIIPVVLSILLMGIYLSQLRVYPEKEFSALRDRRFTPILIDLTYKRHMMLVFLDFILVAFAYYLSYRLRFSGSEFVYYFKIFLKSLPAVIAVKLTVFFVMGIYRGIWAYISTNDVYLYVRSSMMATLLSVVTVTFIYRFQDFSKSIFLIDWIVTTGLLLGTRGSFRLFVETQKRKTLAGDRVLIYGAGCGGELLLREILNNKRLKVKPVGFIDDDLLKNHKKIQGYEILGTFADLERLHCEHKLAGILISFNDSQGHHSSAHDQTIRFCRDHGLFLKRFKVDLQSVDLS